MTKIVPVILSGGSGTRLWPVSRLAFPKQLQRLVGDNTMLQATALRCLPLGAEAPMVVCNSDHRFIIASQLQEVGIQPHSVILEPVGRNTSPAVAVAALLLAEETPDAVMLVLPADHHIRDTAAFAAASRDAVAQAAQGHLATFGIHPTAPATGYGYIRRGAAVDTNVFGVDAFVEKPDEATARDYLAQGNYSWNSGMFAFRADRYLQELESQAPAMVEACRTSIERARRDLDFLRLDEASFEACPPDSIDYAVMEKTKDAVVVPVEMGWSDIGSWDAIWQVGDHDADGNNTVGDVIIDDVSGSLIRSDGPLVSAIGVKDLIIVANSDAVMVIPRERAQDVKIVVDMLQSADRAERTTHLRVQRPWGSYETLDAGDRFQVKNLVVNPGASLSLQMHHHRAEHWVVVQGTAKVTRGEEILTLSENESTFIPVGTKHRLENLGSEPLSLIEIQSGDYLGEDDIVRFEDVYQRDDSEGTGATGDTPRLVKARLAASSRKADA